MLLAICTVSLLATSIQSLTQQPTSTLAVGILKKDSGSSTQQVPTSSPTSSQNILTLNDTNVLQQTKKETDWVTIIVSILSLAVSSVVAYISILRQADIKLCFGRNIIIFPIFINVPTNNVTDAGIGFNLPLTFYNWSPQGGTIERIRLVVGRQNDNNDFYDMTWTTFVKIGSAGNFEDDNLAQPIPVKGLSSVNKVIRFDWTYEQAGNHKFDVQAGNYELRIYGWTKNTQKPSLKYKTSFTIKDKDYQIYKDSVSASLSRAIWISLDENEKPNQLVSRNTIDRLYSE